MSLLVPTVCQHALMFCGSRSKNRFLQFKVSLFLYEADATFKSYAVVIVNIGCSNNGKKLKKDREVERTFFIDRKFNYRFSRMLC